MSRLDHLWNGWRAAYVRGDHPREGSVFSDILASGLPDSETHIVHRGRTVFAILNAFPYASGHLLVLPLREVAEPEDLTAEESSELWSTVTDAVRALRSSHSPDALNIGINLGGAAGGSIARHLHIHVVPRWDGDSNFMTATADTRTLPEPLGDTAARVRSAWPGREERPR
jgi:ATP adenylyltransferase